MINDISELSQQVGDELLKREWKLASAESCTGGAIAAAVTSIAGSSQWFEYGIVSYANQAKQSLLGVSADALGRFGAVSQEVVEQMALGVLKLSGANIAVAVSGIAGPSGGTPEKPVGTVWFAWGLASGKLHSECFHFVGDRSKVQQQAVVYGLQGLLRSLR